MTQYQGVKGYGAMWPSTITCCHVIWWMFLKDGEKYLTCFTCFLFHIPEHFIILNTKMSLSNVLEPQVMFCLGDINSMERCEVHAVGARLGFISFVLSFLLGVKLCCVRSLCLSCPVSFKVFGAKR